MSRDSLGLTIGVVGIILTAFFGGMGVNALWRPRVVYSVVHADTIFGPAVQKDIMFATKRSEMDSLVRSTLDQAKKSGVRSTKVRPGDGSARTTDGETPSLGPMVDLLLRTQLAGLKDSLTSAKVFPNRYVRIEIANNGRAPAHSVRLCLLVPGVVVEHRIRCPSRPNVRASYVKAMAESVPVGVQIAETNLPVLTQGEALAVEVWYSETKLGPELQKVFPEWPTEESVSLASEEGMGVSLASPAQRGGATPWYVAGIALLTLLGVGAQLAAARAARVRRANRRGSRRTATRDG